MNHFEGTIICAVFALPFIVVSIYIIAMCGICWALIPSMLMSVTMTGVGIIEFVWELRDFRDSTGRV